MPKDPIMDIVNNEESLYNAKIAMFDRWVEAGDVMTELRMRKQARALAKEFAQALGGYGERAIDAAVAEMLDEFPEHRDFAIRRAMEFAAARPTPEQKMTPEEVAHAERCEAIARLVGIDILRGLVPAPPERIRKALERGDKHLNSIPLYKWDAAAYALNRPDLSQSERVCALKHVAKWHYA